MYFCNLLSLIAFRLALLFLGLGVAIRALFILRPFEMWQERGGTNPSTDILAILDMICLILAGICNATAFVASLWGMWKGKSKSAFILKFSGVLILVSIALLIVGFVVSSRVQAKLTERDLANIWHPITSPVQH